MDILSNIVKDYKDEKKEDGMMPLSMVKEGEPSIIRKIGGKGEKRKFLENLGFVAGSTVIIVSRMGGNMIVNIKDSRIAIGKDMANKIIV